MTTPFPSPRRRPGPRTRRVASVVVLLAGCSLGGVTISACSSGESGSTTTEAPELAVDPAAARAASAAVVDRLRTEPVATHATGAAGGQQIDITAEVDPATVRMRLDELLNDTIRTELVLDGDRLFGNIYPAADDPPPFTVTDPGAQAPDFVDGALTAGGRVFGDVDVLAAVLERAPGTVFELGTRGSGDAEQRGLRFVFDAHDVGVLLVDEQLERSVLVPEPDVDETTIELWFDHRLRELRVVGAVYQDGELIDDVDVLVEYTPVEEVVVEPPADTVP